MYRVFDFNCGSLRPDEPGSNYKYKATVVSDTPPADIEELIHHTDTIAEIHNTLRKGINITLTA